MRNLIIILTLSFCAFNANSQNLDWSKKVESSIYMYHKVDNLNYTLIVQLSNEIPQTTLLAIEEKFYASEGFHSFNYDSVTNQIEIGFVCQDNVDRLSPYLSSYISDFTCDLQETPLPY